jgi:hypothetical protein
LFSLVTGVRISALRSRERPTTLEEKPASYRKAWRTWGLMRSGAGRRCVRVEVRVASPEPAVGGSVTPGTRLDNRWTMTCGYGFRRTGRTLSIGLRI